LHISDTSSLVYKALVTSANIIHFITVDNVTYIVNI